MSVVIETTLGDLTVDLYTKQRPRTCMNFLKLCKLKAYNFNLFYHVERNFVAQTGDPLGTGRGGESIYGYTSISLQYIARNYHQTFQGEHLCKKLYGEQAKYFEAEQIPKLKHVKPGTLSMVNAGDNMLGSQFFITLGDNLEYLDAEHCVFGEVVEGFDTLLKINDTIVDEKHVPYQDIRITHTVVLEDPFDDPSGLQVPDRSPELTQEIRESGRIGADEDIDDMQGKSIDEIEEMLADREAKARATILEMIGDIPDADVAPPENVLFVCKLNPVTTEEDLMIIFSRFGKIVSCEVIKDNVTGNSLQYAFIEFDNPKSCEDAYFKMDNVLIDDRRIHVDFSQSVSRIRWKGKGRGVDFAGGKSFNPNKEDARGKAEIPPQRKGDFRPDRRRERSRDRFRDGGRKEGYHRGREQRHRMERRSRSRDRTDSRRRHDYERRDRDGSRRAVRRDRSDSRSRLDERKETKEERNSPEVDKRQEKKEKEKKKKKRRRSLSRSSSDSDSSSSTSSEEERKKRKKSKKEKEKKHRKRRSRS